MAAVSIRCHQINAGQPFLVYQLGSRDAPVMIRTGITAAAKNAVMPVTPKNAEIAASDRALESAAAETALYGKATRSLGALTGGAAALAASTVGIFVVCFNALRRRRFGLAEPSAAGRNFAFALLNLLLMDRQYAIRHAKKGL